MGGASWPCSSQGCRDSRWSKAALSILARPYSCRKTERECSSSLLGRRCTRFQAFSTARCLISALETTSDPMRVAADLRGMAERDRSIYRYGQVRVKTCQKALEILMEAMQGQPVLGR